MTDASVRALEGLRDLTTLKWYVIPLLAIVFYVYVREMKEARSSGNWDAVFSGLTLFGIDFFNETWNGWVLALTGRSALWTAPGETALRTMVGWNIEIMFMFLLSGIIWYHTCSDNPKDRILGIPNRWFWAFSYAAFCVFVEILLNKGGLLIWEYSFWNRSFGGIWLIFLIGYFHFYLGMIFVISRKNIRTKLMLVTMIYVIPLLMNVFGFLVMGWTY